MISCNPATLSRDLGILTGTLREENGALVKRAETGEAGVACADVVKSGYFSIEKIEPYDMFPQTKHVETLITLCRK